MKESIVFTASCQQPDCGWESVPGTAHEAQKQAKAHMNDRGHADYVDVPLWDVFANEEKK